MWNKRLFLSCRENKWAGWVTNPARTNISGRSKMGSASLHTLEWGAGPVPATHKRLSEGFITPVYNRNPLKIIWLFCWFSSKEMLAWWLFQVISKLKKNKNQRDRAPLNSVVSSLCPSPPEWLPETQHPPLSCERELRKKNTTAFSFLLPYFEGQTFIRESKINRHLWVAAVPGEKVPGAGWGWGFYTGVLQILHRFYTGVLCCSFPTCPQSHPWPQQGFQLLPP